MAKISPPDEGYETYIQTLQRHLKGKYDDRNSTIDEIREHRLMKKAPKIPEQYKKTSMEHRGPYIDRFLRRLVALIATALPVAKVIPYDSSQAAQDNSSQREKWFNEGVYPLMNAETDTFTKFIDSVVTDGTGVLKCLLQKHRWKVEREKGEADEDYNERVKSVQRRTFPFAWRIVETKNFYPVYDDFGLSEAIETYERSALSVAKKYRLGSGTISGQGGTVKFTEYWNRDVYIYLVDNNIIEGPKRHNYGRLPYFTARANVDGESMASPLISLQECINSFVTIMMNYAYMAAFPILKLRSTDPDAILPIDLQTMEIKLIQGDASILPPGTDLVPFELPAMHSAVTQTLTLLKSILDEVSLAPILYGIPPSSDASGVTTNSLYAIARAVLGPALASIERAFNEMAAFIQECVETLDDPVYVWAKDKWLDLAKNDIKGYYQVRHTLNPVLPAQRQVESLWLANLYQQGFGYEDAVLESMGYHAPEQVRRERMKDMVRKMPEYLNRAIADAFEELGIMPRQPATPAVPPGAGIPGAGMPILPQVTAGQIPPGV